MNKLNFWKIIDLLVVHAGISAVVLLPLHWKIPAIFCLCVVSWLVYGKRLVSLLIRA